MVLSVVALHSLHIVDWVVTFDVQSRAFPSMMICIYYNLAPKSTTNDCSSPNDTSLELDDPGPDQSK